MVRLCGGGCVVRGCVVRGSVVRLFVLFFRVLRRILLYKITPQMPPALGFAAAGAQAHPAVRGDQRQAGAPGHPRAGHPHRAAAAGAPVSCACHLRYFASLLCCSSVSVPLEFLCCSFGVSFLLWRFCPPVGRRCPAALHRAATSWNHVVERMHAWPCPEHCSEHCGISA